MKELAQGGEAEEVEDQMSISQVQATRERLDLAESNPPLAMVNPKGKAPETPSRKLQKKRKKT